MPTRNADEFVKNNGHVRGPDDVIRTNYEDDVILTIFD